MLKKWSWMVLWRPTRPSRTNTKKYVLFIIGDWNAKVGSQEIPGVTGKFGLGIQNEAGQRLIEFCQENTLMLAKIEGRRKRARQRMRWLDGITDSMAMSWVNPGSWWWTGRPAVPCPVLTVASWPAYRFLKRQVRWSGIPSLEDMDSLLWSTQSKVLA